MAKAKKRVISNNKDVYEKAEDLPEGKKKAYDSILEDFDRQGNILQCRLLTNLNTFLIKFQRFSLSVASRIEQINSSIEALQKQIKSQFRVAKVRLPKAVRDDKAENFYYNDGDNDEAIADKLNMTVELAKVAVEITKEVSAEVKNTVKSKGKKASAKLSKKKSSILSQGPALTSTAVRRSTRKRTAPSWISETPLASSTLTAAALGT